MYKLLENKDYKLLYDFENPTYFNLFCKECLSYEKANFRVTKKNKKFFYYCSLIGCSNKIKLIHNHNEIKPLINYNFIPILCPSCYINGTYFLSLFFKKEHNIAKNKKTRCTNCGCLYNLNVGVYQLLSFFKELAEDIDNEQVFLEKRHKLISDSVKNLNKKKVAYLRYNKLLISTKEEFQTFNESENKNYDIIRNPIEYSNLDIIEEKTKPYYLKFCENPKNNDIYDIIESFYYNLYKKIEEEEQQKNKENEINSLNNPTNI